MNDASEQVRVIEAETPDHVAACYPVMAQLRPALSEAEFLRRVELQRNEGYRLACAFVDGRIAAVAGFRVLNNLAWGRFLYVDDLVTDANRRSRGLGQALIEWLKAEAMRSGCTELHLDSGIHRRDAHRFYVREGMDIASYHFLLRDLTPRS